MGKYLDLIARAEVGVRDKSDISDKRDKSASYERQKTPLGCDKSQEGQNGNGLSSPLVATSVAANPLRDGLNRFCRFGRTLTELERRCPACIDPARWHLAVEDGRRFLPQWGEQAEALGWTARDLFGLHEVPANPPPNYQRLSRYDCTGLIWLLQGCPVVALTDATATIKMPTDSKLTYHRHNKPAFGPLGDSTDDFVA